MGDAEHVRVSILPVVVSHLFIESSKTSYGKVRTASFPFLGRRFKTRSVGRRLCEELSSSQCSFQAHKLFMRSRVIFEQLGFSVVVKSADGLAAEEYLIPPNTEPSSPEGQEARIKLLRGWVEMGAYLVDYQRRFGKR